MNAIGGLQVRIDDRIRQRPELLKQVEAATEYFESKSAEYPNYRGEDRGLVWQYQPHPQEGDRLAVAYQEADGYGPRHVTRWIPVDRMCDPVAREVAMLDLLRLTLRKRWYQADEVFERHLRQAEQEERDAHQSD